MRRVLTAALLAAATFGIAIDTGVSPTSAAVPAGFSDTVVANPAGNALSGPTTITAMPDGRALVLEKTGAVRVLSADGTLLAADALALSVCTGSEAGLLGAAPDPAFASNGFVYLYYSRGNCASASGRFNRVSRFTMTGDTINPASEQVLLDNMAIPAGNHNGGDVHFGGDGNLYVAVGDGASNPRGSGPSAAQDLSLLNGKILRITSTGGAPADNPLVGQANAASCATAGITTATSVKCTEIYSYGLRNPYRFAFDPNSANTQFFINDVGQGTWEEVDLGGKGLNYGWDIREGFCANGSSSNCGNTPAGYTDPLTAYNHSTGCSYITAGAFVPNGVWPAAYDGTYLFADGGCGKVWVRTAAGAVNYDSPFATTTGGIVDMKFVKQGNATPLYYVTNGDSRIHRVVYSSAQPVFAGTLSTVTATAPSGAGNVAVDFPLPVATDGSGSVPVSCNPAPGAAFPVGTTTVTCTATNGAGTATTSFAVTVTAAGGAVRDFVPITPYRLAETRSTEARTPDGLFSGGGALAAGSTLQLRVASRGGVAADAAAVSLNVTSVGSTSSGFLTVFPCGSPQPTASSLNYVPGAVVPNAVITKIGTGGNVCIYASFPTHLVVDANGYVPQRSSLVSANPVRVLDTRAGQPTADGAQQGEGLRAAGAITQVKVAGRAGVPANASAAVLNVTATEAVANGFVTVYPCGTAPPTASTLNVRDAAPIANLSVSKIGADGNVCIFTQVPMHLVVDVGGYFPPSTQYGSLTPARLLDTRGGGPTIDGASSGGGPLPIGTVTTVQVRGRGGVLATATTAVLNVTVTNPAAAGFVTVFPCGITPPLASNVNFGAGQTVANAVITQIAANGTVCLYNSQPTDLVVDVNGAFTS